MSSDLPRRRTLESLKKEAKRWLSALRAHDAGARARLQRALPDAPPTPTLRDVQLALAREHGFPGWIALRAFVEAMPADTAVTDRPLRVRAAAARRRDTPLLTTREWEQALQVLRDRPDAALDADGQMTDAMLRDLSAIEHITSLNLSASRALTEDAFAMLARFRDLRSLDLSATEITDRDLSVLRDLPKLESLTLVTTKVTDAGLANLAHCDALEEVNLSWTSTGDGAIRALAGKPRLRHFRTGNGVTDAGLALLHELPVFKTWHGGEPKIALLSPDPAPNHLLLRGPFTDRGMQQLRGLDGLFGLNLDARELQITAAALPPLVTLPHLGWLSVDAKDDWMPHIAEMPHLRYLGAQDTTAGDDGFVALGRSRSIEYIWGRRCHNLQRRGFLALAGMPSLRGLSVSCLNVDDTGISALPQFPALKELMPMDIPDAGYRHIGRCGNLESLILMYCRNTTDAATEHIAGLRKLSYYFNSYTTITDRTPNILSALDSLERVTFDMCHGLTDEGVATLARLPKVRELRVSGKRVTPAVAARFPPECAVHHG